MPGLRITIKHRPGNQNIILPEFQTQGHFIQGLYLLRFAVSFSWRTYKQYLRRSGAAVAGKWPWFDKAQARA
jgi:hypothetical protein